MIQSLGTRATRPGCDTPEGIYTDWNWDGCSLTAEVDRFGFYPLFYCGSDSEIMISTSPVELIARGAPADIDYESLGVFLSIGHYLDEQTPFRAIRVLPPGGRLHWSGTEFRIEKRTLACFSPKDISRSDAVDGAIELFSQAVAYMAEQARRELVVPLSGGRDSRHILLELLRLGYSPQCITWVDNNRGLGPDAMAASQIATAARANHRLLDANYKWTRPCIGLTEQMRRSWSITPSPRTQRRPT